MMKLDGQLTLLASRDKVTMEFNDIASGTRFLHVDVHPLEFVSALGRSACCPCKLDVRGLNNVGKREMTKTIDLPIMEKDGYWSYPDEENEKLVKKIASKHLYSKSGCSYRTHLGSKTGKYVKGEFWYAKITFCFYAENEEEIIHWEKEGFTLSRNREIKYFDDIDTMVDKNLYFDEFIKLFEEERDRKDFSKSLENFYHKVKNAIK